MENVETVVTTAAENIAENADVIVETTGDAVAEASGSVMEALREHAPAIALGAVIIVTGYTAVKYGVPAIRKMITRRKLRAKTEETVERAAEKGAEVVHEMHASASAAKQDIDDVELNSK